MFHSYFCELAFDDIVMDYCILSSNTDALKAAFPQGGIRW